MAIDTVSPGFAAAADGTGEPALAIGDDDADIFGCPTCDRPLVRGSGRCPGCGTRLLLDVPARKASVFVVGGLAAGLMLGVGIAGAAWATRPAAASNPAALPVATTAAGQPGAGTGATAGPATSAVPVAVMAPAAAAAALRGTADVNGRLATVAAGLDEAVTSRASASEIAKLLRRVNLETRSATGMLPSLDGWADALAYRAALTGFYAELSVVVGQALDTSVSNDGAYRSAAAGVIEVLGAIPGLDAQARELAAGGGVTIPPIDLPSVLAGR